MQIVRRNNPISTWSPIDSLIDEYFRLPSTLERLGMDMPSSAADVYETDEEVVVKMAIPGVDPDDINIQVAGDSVTISGETKEENESEGKNFYQKQLRYGRFTQSLLMPTTVKADKAEATFKNGLLTLTLPKSEEVKPKQIKVKSLETKKELK